jgi:16S rRNA (guanine966-N2)-methyltransferase
MDRVKESIFSIIRDRVSEAVVLDLFAGSGSLGLEALSEGARECHLVDNSFQAVRCIKENLNRLHITENVKVINCPSMSYIKRCEQNYDIIFIDPPYKKKLITKVVETIFSKGILKSDGIIVAECGIDEDLSELNNKILKTKIYGDTKIAILGKRVGIND